MHNLLHADAFELIRCGELYHVLYSNLTIDSANLLDTNGLDLNDLADCEQSCCVLALGYNYVWIYKSSSNGSRNLYIQFARKDTNFLVNYSLLKRLKRCNETLKLSN